MASVFLSYDREDAVRARPIAAALEKAGHSVWWDQNIKSGAQYSKEIERALKEVEAVVVLWSQHSIESAWVRDEAAAGRDSGRLVPVKLEAIDPPMGFRQYQTLDLSDGRRRIRSAQLNELLAAIVQVSRPEPPQPRPRSSVALLSRSGRSEQSSPFHVSRRTMLGSAVAAGVGALGGVGLWSVRSRERRFNQLMDLGKQAQLYADGSTKAADYYQQAAAMRPDNSNAEGLFALTQAMVAEDGGPQAGAAVQRAESAARVALAIDPNEPNARLALVTLQRSTLDLATNEDRLREILAIAPDNIAAMGSLWSLLQSAGRSRDALALIERANTLEPLAASIHFPNAQLLWIVGQTAQADRVIDRAMQYWPEHQIVRFARFTIYAYTGRPRAALAMLDDEKTRPQVYSPAAVALWRVSLAALDQRSPASIAAARIANLEASKQDPGLTNQAVLVLSALGEIDAAFDIANRLLLFRHPVEPRPQAGSAKPPVKSTSWRFAPWLFTPPAEPMQADPRFSALCDGIGLTDYWAKRRIKPDYQLRIA